MKRSYRKKRISGKRKSTRRKTYRRKTYKRKSKSRKIMRGGSEKKKKKKKMSKLQLAMQGIKDAHDVADHKAALDLYEKSLAVLRSEIAAGQRPQNELKMFAAGISEVEDEILRRLRQVRGYSEALDEITSLFAQQMVQELKENYKRMEAEGQSVEEIKRVTIKKHIEIVNLISKIYYEGRIFVLSDDHLFEKIGEPLKVTKVDKTFASPEELDRFWGGVAGGHVPQSWSIDRYVIPSLDIHFSAPKKDKGGPDWEGSGSVCDTNGKILLPEPLMKTILLKQKSEETERERKEKLRADSSSATELSEQRGEWRAPGLEPSANPQSKPSSVQD